MKTRPPAYHIPMLDVAVVYLGLAAAFLGVISLLRPVLFLRIHSRKRALLILAAGFLAVVIGVSLPAGLSRVSPTASASHLDQFVPVYQFSEFHSVRIAASREQVYRAIQATTADEILFFRTLVWIRRFGRPGPESILNPPANEPLLAVAQRTSFLRLDEQPDQEIVLGTLVAAPPGWRPSGRPTPEAFKASFVQEHPEPGFAVAAMNFRIAECGPAPSLAKPTVTVDPAQPHVCTLTTETRIFATDASTCRRFARYWRVIYPGSSLIRRMWLRAIARRAEGR